MTSPRPSPRADACLNERLRATIAKVVQPSFEDIGYDDFDQDYMYPIGYNKSMRRMERTGRRPWP